MSTMTLADLGDQHLGQYLTVHGVGGTVRAEGVLREIQHADSQLFGEETTFVIQQETGRSWNVLSSDHPCTVEELAAWVDRTGQPFQGDLFGGDPA